MTHSSTHTHSTPSRLAKRLASHPQASRHRRHTSAVLALREEIQGALDDGWSRRAIWEALFEDRRLEIKYHAFLRYLRRIGMKGARSHPPTTPTAPPTASAPASLRSRSSGFLYSARPNADDLA